MGTNKNVCPFVLSLFNHLNMVPTLPYIQTLHFYSFQLYTHIFVEFRLRNHKLFVIYNQWIPLL